MFYKRRVKQFWDVARKTHRRELMEACDASHAAAWRNRIAMLSPREIGEIFRAEQRARSAAYASDR